MISCNYNGWADAPEDEREGLDAFEAARTPPATASVTPLPLAVVQVPQRKAA